MDILNKSYKRKGATDSDIFVPKTIDGDFVIFSNGARCKIDTLINDFEETTTINMQPQEPSEIIPNADTFFNPISENSELLNQVEKLATNPNAVIEASSKLQESVSLDDNRFEKITPGGQKQPAQSNGLGDRLSNNDEQSQSQIQNENTIPVQRVPEHEVFDKVKLSEEIEITVPFKIRLPRADKLDLLNDMFNISFTAYLAKKYINDNIVNNSVKLQSMIKDAIETWMEDELSSGPKKPKGKESKKSKKSEPVIEVKPVEKETVIAHDKPEDTASTFFGNIPSGPAWDGNLKKLFAITTDEQYNAVKKQFINLKDNNINTGEVDRLEDMLQVYEDSLK